MSERNDRPDKIYIESLEGKRKKFDKNEVYDLMKKLYDEEGE